jgi:hypothetical protein
MLTIRYHLKKKPVQKYFRFSNSLKMTASRRLNFFAKGSFFVICANIGCILASFPGAILEEATG